VKLFALLQAPSVSITLTESFAMWPAASVSGIYLAYPQARYFDLGRIGRDQVEDYAGRKGAAWRTRNGCCRRDWGTEKPARAAKQLP
jgi:hypothetical protein